MSLVDTGAGRAASGTGEGGQLESSRSNIEHRGGRERERERENDGASLLVKRKLNRGGHGSREFARSRCVADGGALDK